MSVKEIDDKSFDDIKKSDKTVVKFWAEWCGPCQMLKPIFEAVSGKITGVDFYSIDVDESPKTSDTFGVMSIPTMILFEKGEEKDRIVGTSNAEALEAEIKQKFGI